MLHWKQGKELNKEVRDSIIDQDIGMMWDCTCEITWIFFNLHQCSLCESGLGCQPGIWAHCFVTHLPVPSSLVPVLLLLTSEGNLVACTAEIRLESIIERMDQLLPGAFCTFRNGVHISGTLHLQNFIHWLRIINNKTIDNIRDTITAVLNLQLYIIWFVGNDVCSLFHNLMVSNWPL